MAEVAGVLLGGISIGLWAFDRYGESVQSSWKYEESIAFYRQQLFLQQEKLEITYKMLGLVKPTLHELRTSLASRFPGKRDEFLEIIQSMEGIIAELLRALEIGENRQPLRSIAPRHQARWDWRRFKHGAKIKQCKRLLERFRDLNDSLSYCLGRAEVPLEEDDERVLQLQAQFSRGRCETIRKSLTSVHMTIESNLKCTCSSPHQAALKIDWEPGPLAAPETFGVALSLPGQNSQHVPGSQLWRRLKFQIDNGKSLENTTDDVSASNATNSPLVASSSNSQDDATGNIRTNPPPLNIFRRLRQVRSLRKGKSLSTPAVRSTVAATGQTYALTSTPVSSSHNSSLCNELRRDSAISYRLGDLADSGNGRMFLNHHPEDTSTISRVIPLMSLLSTQSLPSHLKLSARKRYGLAAGIACAVLHAGDTPWIRDDWGYEQVNTFIETDSAERELPPKYPYISCLFYTPPVQGAEVPRYRFQSTEIHDKPIFALGVFLIELCLNSTFEELKRTSLVSFHDDYDFADRKVEDVYREAGDSYGHAVQRCLRFEFRGTDASRKLGSEAFQKAFYNTVVAPVQARHMKTPKTTLS